MRLKLFKFNCSVIDRMRSLGKEFSFRVYCPTEFGLARYINESYFRGGIWNKLIRLEPIRTLEVKRSSVKGIAQR